MHWSLHTETHPCGNVVIAVITLCLRLGQAGSNLINWTAWSSCVLIGTSRKLATYNYWSSLVLWTSVDANGVCHGIQSRTCYQECGCHLNHTKVNAIIYDDCLEISTLILGIMHSTGIEWTYRQQVWFFQWKVSLSMTRTASLIVLWCKAKLLLFWNGIFNTIMTCIMKLAEGW